MPLSTLRLLLLAALACAGGARADAYGDVSQLLREGHRDQALSSAQTYLLTHPRDPQMRFLLGAIQSDSGQSAHALQTFTLLTQEYPELPEPYNNLAVLYAAQGQYDKALDALGAALRANPDYATAQENLGDVHARLAAQAYARALQLQSDNAAIAAKLKLLRQLWTTPPQPAHAP